MSKTRPQGACKNALCRGNKRRTYNLARGQGFEPRLAGPEPAVLPLDDPRIYSIFPSFPI